MDDHRRILREMTTVLYNRAITGNCSAFRTGVLSRVDFGFYYTAVENIFTEHQHLFRRDCFEALYKKIWELLLRVDYPLRPKNNFDFLVSLAGKDWLGPCAVCELRGHIPDCDCGHYYFLLLYPCGHTVCYNTCSALTTCPCAVKIIKKINITTCYDTDPPLPWDHIIPALEAVSQL